MEECWRLGWSASFIFQTTCFALSHSRDNNKGRRQASYISKQAARGEEKGRSCVEGPTETRQAQRTIPQKNIPF